MDYHPYEGASSDITVGGLYDSGSQVGVFAESDQPLEVNIPASHGACSTYCRYTFYYWHYSTESYVDWSHNCANGCGSTVGNTGCPRKYCSASLVSWTSGGTNNRHRYTAAPCYSAYSSHGGTGTCPNGWGTYQMYINYQAGCNNGSYYPNAIAAYTGPSQVIGSRH